MQENDKQKKRKLAIGAIVAILIFLGILFYFTSTQIGNSLKKSVQNTKVHNNSVVYQPPNLTVFNTSQIINRSPDRIYVHYPYLIVVVPEDYKKITTVYSLTEKKEVASYNDIVLDYFNGDFLYNWHGIETYYKGKDLGLRCQAGFIKSDTEILCITSKTVDSTETKLISINPKTLEKKDIYSSQNILTYVSYINNTLYVSEINTQAGKTYLTIGKSIITTPYISDIVYPMKNSIYTASYRTMGVSPTFYEIVQGKGGLQLKLAGSGKIIYYQQ